MAKRAVLIGINKCQIPGADLRGCVNDVNDMAGVLSDDWLRDMFDRLPAGVNFTVVRYNGALTFALVDAIRKARGRLTYRDLHARASAVLEKKNFDQVPQLEGRMARFDQPVFTS